MAMIRNNGATIRLHKHDEVEENHRILPQEMPTRAPRVAYTLPLQRFPEPDLACLLALITSQVMK